MERGRLDVHEAFTHLRRAARSSGRELPEVAREVAVDKLAMRTTQTDQPNGDAETPKQTPETESAADHQSGRYDIDRLNG